MIQKLTSLDGTNFGLAYARGFVYDNIRSWADTKFTKFVFNSEFKDSFGKPIPAEGEVHLVMANREVSNATIMERVLSLTRRGDLYETD